MSQGGIAEGGDSYGFNLYTNPLYSRNKLGESTNAHGVLQHQTWQDRRRYLLSLAIGRSETAKITPFEKHVNKISVSEGSERKKIAHLRGV